MFFLDANYIEEKNQILSKSSHILTVIRYRVYIKSKLSIPCSYIEKNKIKQGHLQQVCKFITHHFNLLQLQLPFTITNIITITARTAASITPGISVSQPEHFPSAEMKK